MADPLPIDSKLGEIATALRGLRSLVLVAPPGAGKTTRVPPSILDAGLLGTEHPAVVLLQPRRVAARAAAARIAAERGWRLGEEVGYHIRFERRLTPRTRLRVLTEGILTRTLLADPFLEGVGAVVLDEFHERNLDTDLAIALLREVRETVREDLLLIVMSATLDAAPIARFLGDCPVVVAEGRTHPVELEYRPPGVRRPLHESVADAVTHALAAEPSGDLLVFLPGMEEIRRAGRALEATAAREGAVVLPLHGSLSAEEQDRALRPADRRKVVLATNVAETSLTIDGVRVVIDSGLARYASHDPLRGLDRLELGRISRASATQRAGRAGRTAPGRCIRLWSPREERGMPEADVPDVRRVDLAAAVLALHAWGRADPSRFGWFEHPPESALEGAERLLGMLGAVSADGRITPLGRDLLGLPVHPRLGRLLLGASEIGRLHEGATLAALLSEKDLVASGPGARRADDSGRGDSDLLVRLDLLAEAERSRFAPGLRDRGIDPAAARRVAAARDDLLRVARKLSKGSQAAGDDEALLKLILLAYPDRVTRRRGGDGSTGVMVGGRGVRLEPRSVVRDGEFFLSLDPREDRRGGTLEARVGNASRIEPEWLEESFPGSVVRDRAARYDPERGRVVGVTTLSYRDLVIREDRNQPVDPEVAGAALAAELRPRAREILRADEAAAAWLDRLEFVRTAVPDRDWPAIDDEALAEILAGLCAGRRSLEEVQNGSFVSAFDAYLGPVLARALRELAPEALAVPSGNKIRLAYEAGRPPVLAVRLQELFGLAETPRVAGGRVPVVLHLLGPNFRPVQITADLASFWSTTYLQVRKDLRARYPKHSWPDDPLRAKPEAKGGPRRS